jgi:hypothetical protein
MCGEGCLAASLALEVWHFKQLRTPIALLLNPTLPLPNLPRCAVWTGVRLRDVLRAAGLEDEDPAVQHIQARPCLRVFAFPNACPLLLRPRSAAHPGTTAGCSSTCPACLRDAVQRDPCPALNALAQLAGWLAGWLAGCPCLTHASCPCLLPACSSRGSIGTWRASSTGPASRVRPCRPFCPHLHDQALEHRTAPTPALPAPLVHSCLRCSQVFPPSPGPPLHPSSPALLTLRLPCLPTCVPVPALSLQWTKPWTPRATCCWHSR